MLKTGGVFWRNLWAKMIACVEVDGTNETPQFNEAGLRVAFWTLTEKQRDMLMIRVGEGKNLCCIADKYDISITTAWRAERDAFAKIYAHIAGHTETKNFWDLLWGAIIVSKDDVLQISYDKNTQKKLQFAYSGLGHWHQLILRARLENNLSFCTFAKEWGFNYQQAVSLYKDSIDQLQIWLFKNKLSAANIDERISSALINDKCCIEYTLRALTPGIIQRLRRNGIQTIGQLCAITPRDLLQIEGFNQKAVQRIIDTVKVYETQKLNAQ